VVASGRRFEPGASEEIGGSETGPSPEHRKLRSRAGTFTVRKFARLTLSRLANGKVIEEYTNWDTFGMMQQLGIVPELAHA
jgi:hypothetical protein